MKRKRQDIVVDTAGTRNPGGRRSVPADGALSGVRRWCFRGLGVMFVVVAVIGIVLPGLPTTIFLMAAAWCLDRGDPALRERLLSSRLLAPYRPFVEGRAPIPGRVKARAIVVVWLVVGVSAAITLRSSGGSWTLPAVIAGGALIGTWCIARYQPADRRKKARDDDELL